MSAGGDDAGRKSGPRKFAPTLGARKKKSEGPTVTAADAAAANEAFKDLIKAAQSEAKWERGRGRGRGRGREQRFQVAFGADIGRPGRFLPSAKKELKVKDEEMEEVADPSGEGLTIRRKKKKEKGPMLDYSQYYPTMLPFQPPDEEGRGTQDAQESAAAVDLAIQPEIQIIAADELGLSGEDPGAEDLYLFQLPSMLPIRNVEVKEDDMKLARGPAQPAKALPPARSLKELPSGKIGKLKIFASGAVKLQLGDVMFDVEPGMACGCRQEVAALNTSVGHCILMGDISQRVVVSANIWQLMGEDGIPQMVKHEDDGPPIKQEDDVPFAKAANGSNGVARMEVDAST